jgi:hypothetical protein
LGSALIYLNLTKIKKSCYSTWKTLNNFIYKTSSIGQILNLNALWEGVLLCKRMAVELIGYVIHDIMLNLTYILMVSTTAQGQGGKQSCQCHNITIFEHVPDYIVS